MSNGVVSVVKGIGSFLSRWSVRLTKMVRYRLTNQRKSLLVVGEKEHPLYRGMFNAMHKHWEITLVYTTPEPLQELSESSQNQQFVEEISKEVEVAKQTPPPEPKKTFFHQYLMDNNYNTIQKTLEGKQFDSIVVLPNKMHQTYSFQSQNFATEYIEKHHLETMRNIFGYRLASKYLTTSGSLILSAGERDFLKAYSKDYNWSIGNHQQEYSPSTELIDMQTIYLGVILGQRDYTDLNSWPFIALSRQSIDRNIDLVSKQYVRWCSGEQLPMPGSFAFFKQKTPPYKADFMEYI